MYPQLAELYFIWNLQLHLKSVQMLHNHFVSKKKKRKKQQHIPAQ